VVLTERASPAEAGVDTDDFALGSTTGTRTWRASRSTTVCSRRASLSSAPSRRAEFGPKRAGQAGMRHERDACRAGDRGSDPQQSIIEPATHEVLVSAIEPLAAGVETLVSAEVVRSARPDPFGSPFALTWQQLTRMDKGR
jgi:hypothetical protein